MIDIHYYAKHWSFCSNSFGCWRIPISWAIEQTVKLYHIIISLYDNISSLILYGCTNALNTIRGLVSLYEVEYYNIKSQARGAGASDAKNSAERDARPRVRLHHPIKQFAEKRPGGHVCARWRNGLCQISLNSHTLGVLSFYFYLHQGPRALSRVHARRERRPALKKNENKNTHTHQIHSVKKGSTCGRALKVEKHGTCRRERCISHARASSLSLSQGWTRQRMTRSAKGQCTSGFSCNIQFTQATAPRAAKSCTSLPHLQKSDFNLFYLLLGFLYKLIVHPDHCSLVLKRSHPELT